MTLNSYSEEIHNALKQLDQEAVRIYSFILSNFGGIVYTCGNGGSGTTASHFTQDLINACGIRSICLNDNIGLITSIANDLDFEDVFAIQAIRLVTRRDILFVISGSGNSPNIIEVVNVAKSTIKCRTISLTGFDGGEVSKITDYNITVPLYDMRQVESSHSLLLHYMVHTLDEKSV